MTDVSVYVHGYDGVGWSIDADRANTEQLLMESGLKLTRNPLGADVIHFVWWNQAYRYRYLRKLSRAKWLAVITNTISESTKQFPEMRSVIDMWVVANKAQGEWINRQGLAFGYQPFYVDDRVFHPIELDRASLCASIGIDPSVVGGKVLIGSFQRDTESNLIKPKWQKGPELLIAILREIEIPKHEWLVVLAGPRRHWLIEQCDRYDIPYCFVGSRPSAGIDDIRQNRLEKEVMAFLYNLVDVYVVSSMLEGGPKAVMECALSGTAMISTAVGLAPDMLSERSLYGTKESGAYLLSAMIRDRELRRALSKENLIRVRSNMSRSLSISRWRSIYQNMLLGSNACLDG